MAQKLSITLNPPIHRTFLIMNVLLWCSTTIDGRIHYNTVRTKNSSSNACQEAYRNLSPEQKSRCKYVLYLVNSFWTKPHRIRPQKLMTLQVHIFGFVKPTRTKIPPFDSAFQALYRALNQLHADE